VLAAISSWIILRNRESVKVKVPVDFVGLILLVVGVASLQYLLDNGNDLNWFASGRIQAAAAISVVALAFLIPWELTDAHPIVDLHLFKRRNFVVGSLAISAGYFAFMGVNVVFPLWLQTTLGYTSTWAGYAIAPVGVVALFLAPVIGKNIHRINLRIAPTFAFSVFALSLFWVSKLNDQASFMQLATPRILQGFGLALFFLPINQIIMAGVSGNELASAAGLSNFLRTISGSLSTAVCVWLWSDRTEYHHGQLIQTVAANAPNTLAYQAQLGQLGIEGVPAQAVMERVIGSQASTLGANDVFMLLFVLYIAMIPFIWLARPPFGAAGTRAGGH
jgi:DHA2 family multidrug resistance protein